MLALSGCGESYEISVEDASREADASIDVDTMDGGLAPRDVGVIEAEPALVRLADAYCAGIALCPLAGEARALVDHLDPDWCRARLLPRLERVWTSLDDSSAVDTCARALASRCIDDVERRGGRRRELIPGCEALYPNEPLEDGAECVLHGQCGEGSTCSFGVEDGCDTSAAVCAPRPTECREDAHCPATDSPDTFNACVWDGGFVCFEVGLGDDVGGDEPCGSLFVDERPVLRACSEGWVCAFDGDTRRCERPGEPGAVCNRSEFVDTCGAGLLCVPETSTGDGRCVVPPLGTDEGDACFMDGGIDTCDERTGLVCDDGTCRRVTGELGTVCSLSPGSTLRCVDGLRCQGGVCVERRLEPVGGSCRYGGDCASGACDRERGVCVAACAR